MGHNRDNIGDAQTYFRHKSCAWINADLTVNLAVIWSTYIGQCVEDRDSLALSPE